MIRPPFKILPSTSGVYRRNGKFVCGGRTSFCWETLVMAVASGVPGPHEIRLERGPWYRIDMSIRQAEESLDPNHDFFGKRRLARARKNRAARAKRS